MVVLYVGELRQQLVVVAFFSALKVSGVLKCVPVLTLNSSKPTDVKIRKRLQHVRAKRLGTRFLGVIFDQLTPASGETMDGYRVLII